MTVDGWIPVTPSLFETAFPDVYAVGDVTSVGTPKAGVFAEGQASWSADARSPRLRGASRPHPVTTATGSAISNSATTWSARVEVTFVSGAAPRGCPGRSSRRRSPPTKTTFGTTGSDGGSIAPESEKPTRPVGEIR